MSKRTKFFGIFLCSLFFINILMLITSFQIFPNYGGFSRQILFIKPNNQTAGYFIIIDELSPEAQGYEIDWLLHSRGALNLSSDQQSLIYTTPSYISNDNVSLQVSFLEEISEITEESGYFLPIQYREPYPYDDFRTSYIKARYLGSENPIMAAVLYPKNDSDIGQNFPNITKEASGLRKIGNTDYLYYNEKEVDITFSMPNISFNGRFFFLRQNKTNPTLLEYLYLQNARNLEFESINYFSSSRPILNILATYSNGSQISGALKIASGISTAITLYAPFAVEKVELNGMNTTFTNTSTTVSFSVNGPCSFVISPNNDTYSSEYDPLRDPSPSRVMPQMSEWGLNFSLIQDLNHSYILYSQDDLPDLRTKFNDPLKDWDSWYSSTISGVDSITNASDYDTEARYNYVYKLALKYVIDGGSSYLTKLVEFLKDMGSIDHYSQDLERSYNLEAYAIAFDMVYNNLTIPDRNEIYNLLYNHAEPLMQMDLYPENNHRVVDAGALGVTGLALKEKSMVDKAIETILTYYYTFNPVDGGSHEGYSYNAFAMMRFLNFAIGLKRVGGYNLFNNSQVLATFDFMSETLGPLGMPSLYEDCDFSSRIQEVLLIAAANVNDTHPQRAQNYQYIWEQRQNNSQYQVVSTSYYTYLNGGWPGFNRLMGYNVNETIEAKPFQTRKEIWKDSGMAFLRSEDQPNGVFLSFNCKYYPQSHVHYDENSFEIWAYGAYIIHHPGYPGFGKTHHDYTIDTEASNSILIDNSRQLQEVAFGLSDSISSPYFSMVVGDARQIYTDLASFINAPELVLLLALNLSLLCVASVSFVYYLKHRRASGLIEPKEQKIRNNNSHINEITKAALLKMLFLHPYQVQDYLVSEDPDNRKTNFLNRTINLLIAGLMVLFFLIIIFDIFSMLNYHMQYYEENSQLLIDMLNITKLFLLTAGPLLTFSCSLLAISVYSRLNRTQIRIALNNQKIGIDKKKINAISKASIVWFIPILVFSFLLLYFTTSSSFKSTIHDIFVGSGSILFIYSEISLLLREFITNVFIILLVSIPSLLICLKIFGYGASRNTDGAISPKKGSLISLTSYIVLITLFFFLVAFLFFGVKYVISIVGIEGFIL